MKAWTLPFRWLASLPARVRWHRAWRRWSDSDMTDDAALAALFRESEKVVRLGFCQYNPPTGHCYVHTEEGCP